jgi:ribosome-binding protein aMBF1 (putative translation factor)
MGDCRGPARKLRVSSVDIPERSGERERFMRSEKESPCALGDALQSCRTEAGLSHEDLAQEAQVAEEELRAWESGRGTAPTLPTVRALAHALEMSTCELIQAADCD